MICGSHSLRLPCQQGSTAYEIPKGLELLKFREEVLDGMKRFENQDDMAIFFSLQLLGLVCNRQQQQHQQSLTS